MAWNTHIPKFRRFVLQNFPFIEEDFDALTDYALICKVVEFLNTVINSQNEVISELSEFETSVNNEINQFETTVNTEINRFETSITEDFQNLTNLFNQLQSFVENYFDNLDVQEEINTKLDAMVEDGTMDQIINQEIFGRINAAIGDLSQLQTVNKNDLVAGINSANMNTIDYYRRKYGNNYRIFTNKGGVPYFDNVEIYKDIYNDSFDYKIDIESFKNTGGSTIYVNPASTESSSQQTGALDHPFNSIKKAYDVASDGDTIALFGGIYYRNNTAFGSTSRLSKNLNLIPYNNEKVYLTNADKLSFTQNATYSDVYEATRTNSCLGIDMRYKEKDVFPRLAKVDTLEACHNTKNSYAQIGSTIYVNIGETPTSEKVIFPLTIGSYMMEIEPTVGNLKVYLEKLTCIGGDLGIFGITGSSTYTCEVIATECNFYFGVGESANAITVTGSNTIFHKCKACFGGRDGFNYHKQDSVLCNSIELDCVGANNGLESSQNNNNGSTTHDGNKCLRINGVYFNNKGGNVTDVQTNTYSLNINCVAFDSKSTGTTSKGDFVAQQAGVTMDLYNCYAKGSDSYVNIYGVADTTLNVHNCNVDNAYSDGTIVID